MVTWGVVGSAGMLGQDMMARIRRSGAQAVGLTRPDLDITDAPACHDALAGFDVVVNCAAWTDVDGAENDEAGAFAANAVGAANLARASAAHGARLVQVSTDYVFAGDATTPYGEDAAVAPRSAYGRTKAAGEWAVLAASPEHLVVRTAWLYGAGGPCFPATMARLLRERGSVAVVTDQVGQPTWTVDVADLVYRAIGSRAPGGIYHATSSGQTSWFGFTRAIAASAGFAEESVTETTSAAFVRPAPRPSYSVLGHEAWAAHGIEPIGPWEQRWKTAAPSIVAGTV